MATIEECQSALGRLSASFSKPGASGKTSSIPERSVSCQVPDLGVLFSGRLDGAGFHDITTDPAPPAQIRLTVPSDDLVALADGKVSFASAWSKGRVKVDASFGDLLRLRKLF